MTTKAHFADTKAWQASQFGNLELLRARHHTQTFPKHTHECYAVGIIEHGALGFYYRGLDVVARQGDISLCIPGEVHTGHPASAEGWGYRMFYFDAGFLKTIAAESSGQPSDVPFFRSGVINDPTLAGYLRRAHLQLESNSASSMAQETGLIAALAQLVHRHADAPIRPSPLTREPDAVARVKAYLEEHYADEVSLDQLCQLTRLSRFHLVRVFCEAVGVPPHAYLRQIRVNRAKALLAAGQPIAAVASNTGFADQSHLTRWLKRLWGVTPGQVHNNSNSVQDG